MINKTVRAEAALVVQLQAEILISRPLFWQLAPLKHEIPPNLRFEIFYRHNKVLSLGGRERAVAEFISPSDSTATAARLLLLRRAHAGDTGAQGCQRKRFLPNVVITRSGEHCSVQRRVIVGCRCTPPCQYTSPTVGPLLLSATVPEYYHSNGSSRLTEKKSP